MRPFATQGWTLLGMGQQGGRQISVCCGMGWRKPQRDRGTLYNTRAGTEDRQQQPPGSCENGAAGWPQTQHGVPVVAPSQVPVLAHHSTAGVPCWRGCHCRAGWGRTAEDE